MTSLGLANISLRDCIDSSHKQIAGAGKLGMQRSQQQFPQDTKEDVMLHSSKS